MRIASRIIGVVLALAGLAFLVLSLFFVLAFRPESVLDGPQLGRRLTSGLPALGIAFGLILAGWCFLKLDVDRLDARRDPSRFVPFFVAHRRALTFIALIGLVISLARASA